MPWPSVNSNGVPRSRDESNFSPFLYRVPVSAQRGVSAGHGKRCCGDWGLDRVQCMASLSPFWVLRSHSAGRYLTPMRSGASGRGARGAVGARHGVSGGASTVRGHARRIRTGGEVLLGEGLAHEQRGGDEAGDNGEQLHGERKSGEVLEIPHNWPCWLHRRMPWRGTVEDFCAWAPARAVELDAAACRPVVAQLNAVLAVLHRLEHETVRVAATWEPERWSAVMRPLVDNIVLRCRRVREPASARLLSAARLGDLTERAERDGLALIRMIEGFAESLSRLMDGQGAEAADSVASFLEWAHHEAQDLLGETGHLNDLVSTHSGATERSDHLEQVRRPCQSLAQRLPLTRRAARHCPPCRIRGARARIRGVGEGGRGGGVSRGGRVSRVQSHLCRRLAQCDHHGGSPVQQCPTRLTRVPCPAQHPLDARRAPGSGAGR